MILWGNPSDHTQLLVCSECTIYQLLNKTLSHILEGISIPSNTSGWTWIHPCFKKHAIHFVWLLLADKASTEFYSHFRSNHTATVAHPIVFQLSEKNAGWDYLFVAPSPRQFSPCCVDQIRIHTLQPVVLTQKHPITSSPGQQWRWGCRDAMMNLFIAAGQNRTICIDVVVVSVDPF